MSADKIYVFAGILFFGALLYYYLIYEAPQSDLLYSTRSRSLIAELEAHLRANDISTYTKNTTIRNLGRATTMNPSLHVVNLEDKERALRLINENLQHVNHHK